MEDSPLNVVVIDNVIYFEYQFKNNMTSSKFIVMVKKCDNNYEICMMDHNFNIYKSDSIENNDIYMWNTNDKIFMRVFKFNYILIDFGDFHLYTQCFFIKNKKNCINKFQTLYKYIINHSCIFEKCKKIAKYNYATESIPLYCIHHKKELMCLKFPMCTEQNCSKRATYSFTNGIKPVFCKMHRKKDMINFYYDNCLECNIIASFGYPKTKKPLYCAKHKKEDMINMRQCKCLEPDCEVTATFNYAGKQVGIFCYLHKDDKMVNIKKNYYYCIEEGCMNYKYYSFMGQPALYCSLHKKENMVNVRHRRCIEENCSTISYYGSPDDGKPLYCASHKKNGMINVVNKLCDFCPKIAYYGFDHRKMVCAEHKQIGMTNNRKRCREN